MHRLVDSISSELAEAGTCLEIGVGTGRFALPLARAGVRIVGVDISSAMLRRLVEKSEGLVVPLALADATRLPFREGTFGAGIAAHVLHLIPQWRTAIGELLRVIRPGGKVGACGRHRADDGWLRDLRHAFFASAGGESWPPGMDTLEQLDEE